MLTGAAGPAGQGQGELEHREVLGSMIVMLQWHGRQHNLWVPQNSQSAKLCTQRLLY